MPKLEKNLKTGLGADENGATAVEYGLLLALMVLALVGALAATGNSNQDQWDDVSEKVGDAMTEAGVS